MGMGQGGRGTTNKGVTSEWYQYDCYEHKYTYTIDIHNIIINK
jgi:hypothetical protein